MFMTLCLKECKQIGKSMLYYILFGCMLFFFMSQLGGKNWRLEKPVEGQSDYGVVYSKEESLIMEHTFTDLAFSYMQNAYMAYPLGFYKNVVLGGEKLDEMGKILEELSGLSGEALQKAMDEAREKTEQGGAGGAPVGPEITLSETVTYDRFLKLMKKADKLIGGHSVYAPETLLERGTLTSQTYEGALKEYRMILEKDRYTGAYAREFCDYMSLVLAILPVFLAAAGRIRDKRAGADLVIGSRQASSVQIICSRYLACLFMVMIPVAVMALFCHVNCVLAAGAEGISVDPFAFAKYVGGWLLPEAAFTVAAGFLAGELFGGLFAVFLQCVFWFVSMFQSFGGLNGNFGLKFIPRFNRFGNTEAFFAEFTDLIFNRLFYASLAGLLIMLTVILYRWKREGGVIGNGKLRKGGRGIA